MNRSFNTVKLIDVVIKGSVTPNEREVIVHNAHITYAKGMWNMGRERIPKKTKKKKTLAFQEEDIKNGGLQRLDNGPGVFQFIRSKNTSWTDGSCVAGRGISRYGGEFEWKEILRENALEIVRHGKKRPVKKNNTRV